MSVTPASPVLTVNRPRYYRLCQSRRKHPVIYRHLAGCDYAYRVYYAFTKREWVGVASRSITSIKVDFYRDTVSWTEIFPPKLRLPPCL